jgi:hypothetical protein
VYRRVIEMNNQLSLAFFSAFPITFRRKGLKNLLSEINGSHLQPFRHDTRDPFIRPLEKHGQYSLFVEVTLSFHLSEVIHRSNPLMLLWVGIKCPRLVPGEDVVKMRVLKSFES